MKLSVIMPIYNEASTVREIINRVRKVNLEKEIIVVDDGSTDGTREILKSVESLKFKVESKKPETDIKIIYHLQNEGKGAAIRTALEYITGDIVIIQDGDLEYCPEDYFRLVKPIMRGEAEVVYGSRILQKRERTSYWRYYWGGKFLTLMANLLYRANITDEPTCYKVFPAGLLKSLDLKCRRFEFCPEVTAKVCKRGYKIYEVPINCNSRTVEEGKKIKWTDGLVALWILIKYKFKG